MCRNSTSSPSKIKFFKEIQNERKTQQKRYFSITAQLGTDCNFWHLILKRIIAVVYNTIPDDPMILCFNSFSDFYSSAIQKHSLICCLHMLFEIWRGLSIMWACLRTTNSILCTLHQRKQQPTSSVGYTWHAILFTFLLPTWIYLPKSACKDFPAFGTKFIIKTFFVV